MTTETSKTLGNIKALGNLKGMELTPEGVRRAAVFLGTQLGALALGAVLAQAQFAGGVFSAAAPFAIALAAAGSIRFLGMEVLGIALGCLMRLPYPISISAMAAAAAAGLFNLALRKLGLKRKVFVPLSAFACAAASGVICMLTPAAGAVQQKGPMGWLYALCGAVLCGCAAYFIVLAQTGWMGTDAGGRGGAARGCYKLTPKLRAALLLCCSFALASCGGLTVGLFRPVHVLAVLFVLAAAYCWREAGGAVAGCCAGAALVLAGDDPASAAVFALGGLLAGVFSSFHAGQEKSGLTHHSSRAKEDHYAPSAFLTVPVAGGFALVCVFFVALRAANENDPAATVMFAIESLVAVLLFIMVPAKAWNMLLRRFHVSDAASFAPPESEAALQLSQTAGALRKVSEYVEEVAEGLEKLQAPAEQGVFAMAAEEVCKQCPEYPYCYEEHMASSAKLSASTSKILRKSGALALEEWEDTRRACGLSQPCRTPETMRQALVRAYDIHCARQLGSRAESQLRHAAAQQFDSLSALLEELGANLARQKIFDAETAESAARVLDDHGFRARSVVCARGDEMAAQLRAQVLPEAEHSTREELTAAIGRATGIRFELPELSHVAGEGEAVLTFAQRPSFALSTGAVQMSSSSSAYCGDYFDCFNDGRGREVLVISDGMGTGGRAAVDSALATEIFSALVRSGLSFEGAVRIANQALLLKSCEESLATLDAAGVNLYTGEVEFCKAGGAASFLRLRGQASKLELSALPAGILRNIHPARCGATLECGDVLVLVSDGMLCEQDDWLCEQLEAYSGGDMQELAERLAGLAVTRRQEAEGRTQEREDDLTVICARLEKR